MTKLFVLWIIGTISAAQIAAADAPLGNDTPTNEIDGTFDSSSYDTPPYVLWGDYFASHFYDMYPQFTNHIYSVSRSGASWENQFEEQQEEWCLPLWASFGTADIHDWMLANDNGYYVSNDVIQWGTNLFNAPPLFWNGTAVTNEGGIASTLSVTHYSLGGIPYDAPDGDGGYGAISRNAGAMALARLYGTPVVDMWHLLWTNGLSTDIVGPRLFGFYPGSHPYPAGHLCMAIQCLVALGVETNVGSLTLNWSNASADTNHCVVSGITVATNSLACTVHFDRMPMAWDVPDGTITNDARNAFVVMPQLGNAFQWIIRVTNAPPGTYALNVDGVLTDIATDTELAAGRNWFTNYNGPLWAQRTSVLAWKRIQAACDPVTLDPSHDAGSLGFLGVGDLENFQSWASEEYNTLGLRGDAYIKSMTNWVAQLRQYDVAIHQAAQQTNHVLSITIIVAPVILVPPQSAVAPANTAVSFSVGLGGAQPFSYQWLLNDAPIPDATNSSYTIASAATNEAGAYSVVVTNFYGSVTSPPAMLTIGYLPVISRQPVSQTVSTGSAVAFSVQASAYPAPAYQWEFDGTNIIGATNSSYTIGTGSDSDVGYYEVVASNAIGSVTSSEASLAFVGIQMYPGNYAGISIDGPLGANYSLQSISQIGGTVWNTLTNVSLPSQPYIYLDSSARTNSQQFYRVVPLP